MTDSEYGTIALKECRERWSKSIFNVLNMPKRKRVKKKVELPLTEKTSTRKRSSLKKSSQKIIITEKRVTTKPVPSNCCNCCEKMKEMLNKTHDIFQVEREENRKVMMQQMETISSLSIMFINAVQSSPLMETMKNMHIGLVGELVKSKLRNTNERGLQESISIRVKSDCVLFTKIFGINTVECTKCSINAEVNYSCMQCEILSPRVLYLPKSGTSYYVIKTMDRVQDVFGPKNWFKTFPSGSCSFITTSCFYETAGQVPRRGVIIGKNESLYNVWFPLEVKEKQDTDLSGVHVLPFAGIPLRGCVKQLKESEFKVERSAVLQHNPNGSSRFLFKFMVVDRDGYVVAGVCNYSIFSSIPNDIY